MSTEFLHGVLLKRDPTCLVTQKKDIKKQKDKLAAMEKEAEEEKARAKG